MNRTATRPSLLTRISEASARASTTVDRSYRETARQESYVERYRGTEYETPTPMIVVQRDTMSRGRSFVIMVGTAVVSLLSLLMVAAGG